MIKKLFKFLILIIITGFVLRTDLIDKINFSLFSNEIYASNISRFIAIDSADEYILSTLTTTETFQEARSKKILGKEIPGTKSVASLNINASFRYFIKLAELEFRSENQSIEFIIPRIYLSKPVGFDSPTFNCNDQVFGNCKNIYNSILQKIPLELETKGISNFNNVYDTASKAIADNYYKFFKLNNKNQSIRRISVKIKSEDSKSIRVFNYD